MSPPASNRVGTATDLTFASDLEASAFLRRFVRSVGWAPLRRVLMACAPSLCLASVVGDARLIEATAPRLHRGDFVVRAWNRGRGPTLVVPMPAAEGEAPAEVFIEEEVIVEEVLDAGPQEAALLAAAETGAPFCEECEKAKRQQEAAA